jgi:hypothetical protein
VPPPADISAIDGWDRVRDALTELHAYVLILDGELERTEARLVELRSFGSRTAELRALRRRRSDIAAQLELLGRVIIALRAAADPTGERL